MKPAKEPPSRSWWKEMARRGKGTKFIQQKQNKVDPKTGDTVRAKE